MADEFFFFFNVAPKKHDVRTARANKNRYYRQISENFPRPLCHGVSRRHSQNV